MNKAELAKAVADHMGISKKLAKDVLDVAIYQITGCVKSGDPVKLQEFGTFKPKTKPGGVRRNPRTGEEFEVVSSNAVKFVPSKMFLEKLNW